MVEAELSTTKTSDLDMVTVAPYYLVMRYVVIEEGEEVKTRVILEAIRPTNLLVLYKAQWTKRNPFPITCTTYPTLHSTSACF